MGSLIKVAIVDRGRTITDVAESIGLTYDQLSNIINGRKKLSTPIAEQLRVELERPEGWPYVELAGNFTSVPFAELRILGSVSAGDGADAYDESSMPVPMTLVTDDRVGWIVSGDSMLPFLQEGDIAVFKEARVPRLGFPNLVRTKDGQYRAKIVKFDGSQYTLHSLNQSYSPEPGEVEWKGYLVGIYRTAGSFEMMLHDAGGLRPD